MTSLNLQQKPGCKKNLNDDEMSLERIERPKYNFKNQYCNDSHIITCALPPEQTDKTNEKEAFVRPKVQRHRYQQQMP